MDDTKVYVFIYKYAQTGVICWAEEGPNWNAILTVNILLQMILNLEYVTITINNI